MNMRIRITLTMNGYIGCWDDGELNGTCACRIDPDMDVDEIQKILDDMRYYLWKDYTCVYLIAGDDAESGNDINETIIENAVILALVQKED